MRTEDLIRHLVGEVEPVRPLRSLTVRLLAWIVIAAVSFGAVVMVSGVRSDLAQAAGRSGFALEAALLIITALAAAVGALVVSVPGAERTALVRWVPIIAGSGVILWVAGDLVVAAATGGQTGSPALAWGCVLKTASVAAVPGVALFVMVRQAAPLRAVWAGLLALLATAAVGVLGANVICPNDRPWHMLVWHVGPLMLFAGFGAALGAWLLTWTRRLRPRPGSEAPLG